MVTRPDPAPGLPFRARLQGAGDPCPGIAALDRVQAILRNPAVYHLAGAIPRARGATGRPRDYPQFMHLVFDALISVYGSARQVEAELGNRVVWKSMRRTLKKVFPHDPAMRLPSRPMRRHHYLYFRNRYQPTLARWPASRQPTGSSLRRRPGRSDCWTPMGPVPGRTLT